MRMKKDDGGLCMCVLQFLTYVAEVSKLSPNANRHGSVVSSEDLEMQGPLRECRVGFVSLATLVALVYRNTSCYQPAYAVLRSVRKSYVSPAMTQFI